MRAEAGDLVEVASAGSRPLGHVHPRAIAAMAEIGIDIRAQRSKHVNEYIGKPVHTVITVCGNADRECPNFPGQVQRYHWPFDDPGNAVGTEDEIVAEFRRVRDEIRRVFTAFAAGLRVFARSK